MTTFEGGPINTAAMAAALGVSVRTLHHYRADTAVWIEGRHYWRKTPSSSAHWLWDRELTLKAWAAERGLSAARRAVAEKAQ